MKNSLKVSFFTQKGEAWKELLYLTGEFLWHKKLDYHSFAHRFI